MRIGINCLRLDPEYVGGLNTYTLGLLNGFASVANGHAFHIYCTDRNRILFRKFANDRRFTLHSMNHTAFHFRQCTGRAAMLSRSSEIYRRVSNQLFRAFREEMDSEVDLLHTPTDLLQAFDSQKPAVLTVHDLQHLHYPEFFDWSRRLSRKMTYSLSARAATHLHVSSNFVREDLLRQFPDLSPQKISVIPEGVDIAAFSVPQDSRHLVTRYGLPERFIFCPAQLWPHKNHLTVLKALLQIAQTEKLEIPLVLTGASFQAAPAILRFIRDHKMSHVLYLGKVPFEDMVGLYQRADFLLTASLFESSSLPIVEAAAAGTPILASSIPPHLELAQTLQLNLFSPGDANDLAQAVLSRWTHPAVGRAQAAHNREQISNFSWHSTAARFLELFESAAA
jgi:glycosyltransferase involved in cell wall biosynthesis